MEFHQKFKESFVHLEKLHFKNSCISSIKLSNFVFRVIKINSRKNHFRKVKNLEQKRCTKLKFMFSQIWVGEFGTKRKNSPSQVRHCCFVKEFSETKKKIIKINKSKLPFNNISRNKTTWQNLFKTNIL